MKNKYITLIIAFMLALFSSCKPYKKELLVRIDPNETGFVIPMEDASEQQKFESIEYLSNHQVATKQISVPQRWYSTGRLWFRGKWIPTHRVMKVNRTPVTRSWTTSPTEGKELTNSNRVFGVESKDSIGFAVGVNVSSYIDEADTSRFLYFYRENELAGIMDQNVRERVHTLLSREFAKVTLEESKENKVQITETVAKEVTQHFKEFGITITSIGLAEGLEFEQPEIQQAINQAYVAEMEVKRQRQEVERQREVNKKLLAAAEGENAALIERAKGEKEAAEIFSQAADIRERLVQLEIEKLDAETRNKWDGKLPTTSLSGDAGALLNLK